MHDFSFVLATHALIVTISYTGTYMVAVLSHMRSGLHPIRCSKRSTDVCSKSISINVGVTVAVSYVASIPHAIGRAKYCRFRNSK